ncbi:hypothetical protein C8N25_11332 [Algoriphagus antarcticus]|uniref:Uncharacterized protein n=1 Tax=Algoriphagus antarcticus TaxID=238540 RepID=A0A3E0DQE4_9BACT|nr:hypothetical protein C8N25_11332 [Algoriphagus antarcticus]
MEGGDVRVDEFVVGGKETENAGQKLPGQEKGGRQCV